MAPADWERLFAAWSRVPLPRSLDRLHSLVEGGEAAVARPYRATRDRKLVQRLAAGDWHALVLELDHG
jgi:hypothetical protein